MSFRTRSIRNTLMTRFGYARVSTVHQDFAAQVQALQAASCNEIIRERASGAKSDRPRLVDLLDMVGPGDSIVVVRLDRLARSVSQLIAIMQQIEARGVTFISLGDNIDTSTASGRLTFHIFAALAEFERNLIIERTKAGLDAARAAGRTGGRPLALTPSQVEKARQWIKDRTMTQQQAANALGVARSTLARALR